MNYKKIYESLISKAKEREIEGYKERHHILPRCIGGDDSEDNLVDLTAREHVFAHILLATIYPANEKLLHAAWHMSNGSSGPGQEARKLTSKAAGWLRESYSKMLSNKYKGKTMAERIGDPNYVSPLKGISKPSPRKGSKMPKDWVNPKSKPFKIIRGNGEEMYFKNERDFFAVTKMTYCKAFKLLKGGESITIQRRKNTKHIFNHKEELTLEHL